jgi:Cu2+-exporting ATPase
MPEDAPRVCRHCATPLATITTTAVERALLEKGFCCTGCEAVFGLLHAAKLDRYYDLGGGVGFPIAGQKAARDHKWLEPFEAELAAAGNGAARIELDVQGMHCSACVWLIDELFAREQRAARSAATAGDDAAKASGSEAGAQRTGPSGLSCTVNPSLGRLQILARKDFPLRRFVETIERFGYVMGPPRRAAQTSSSLVARMGICIAIAMNSMILAVSIYAGLEEPALLALFHKLNFTFSIASVAVGGTVFFKSAWQAIRRGILHLDIPIAVGIVLAFAGSAHSFFYRASEAAYFDTLNVFIALMLVGRWLQERVLERNRRFLLENDGTDGLLTRRLESGEARLVPCREVEAGDRLLVSPGDLVPVDAALEDASATCSLDWINGESRPMEFSRGDRIPAGAFSAGSRAIVVRAATNFSASTLVELLRMPVAREGEASRSTAFWQRFVRIYVVTVLLLAALAIPLWMAKTGDVKRALDVATAVLIVTCPCALGIATPLGYDIVQSRLRRAGLFVRAPGFLDRAVAVKRVVFDKTGTLTTGTLRLADRTPLVELAPRDRGILYDLAARSTHPKSVALAEELAALGHTVDDAVLVDEYAGLGLEARALGATYRLGRAAWACAGAVQGGGDLETDEVVFAKDGVKLATFRLEEELRPGAADEIAQLRNDGYEVRILSGDAEARVTALAKSVGLPPESAVFGQTPQGKEAWLAAHDHGDTLMVGDGINDALVVERAHCSGTPAIDRPFMAARSDFYFITPGLSPVRMALRASRALRRLVHRNIAVAVFYNLTTVALAYAGLMSPLLCAVVMPVTSLTIVLATVFSLSKTASANA